MKWVEVPGFNFFHSVNAWDEKGGEEVVLVAANVMPVEDNPTLRHQQWVEVLGFNFFHSVNAWDEKGGEEVVLVAANVMPVEYLLEMRMDLLHFCLEMVWINVRERKLVGRKPLMAWSLELGVINPKFQGIKNRYAFMAKGDFNGKFSGVVKLDFDQADSSGIVEKDASLGSHFLWGKRKMATKTTAIC
ncbi:hypothetical protein EJ110_NYTH28600 [Nymphaea thermarum]|nr:hypothetical protein EJ110_NYTH28600 [Nymphaea thermarum]